MKNTFKMVMAIALITVLAFAFVSCGGGDDPKSLAKQSYDLTLKMFADMGNPNLEAEAKKLEEKYNKLSDADREIFDAEVMRLFGM